MQSASMDPMVYGYHSRISFFPSSSCLAAALLHLEPSPDTFPQSHIRLLARGRPGDAGQDVEPVLLVCHQAEGNSHLGSRGGRWEVLKCVWGGGSEVHTQGRQAEGNSIVYQGLPHRHTCPTHEPGIFPPNTSPAQSTMWMHLLVGKHEDGRQGPDPLSHTCPIQTSPPHTCLLASTRMALSCRCA